MTFSVSKYAMLPLLVKRARSTLSNDSSLRECTDAFVSSGLTAFVQTVIKAYTGLEDVRIVPSKSSRPAAFMSMCFLKSPQTQETATGVEIINSFGEKSPSLKSPFLRDLLRVLEKSNTRVIKRVPSANRFFVSISLSKGLLFSQQNGTLLFSDREIAAVICHEIGHCVYAANAAFAIVTQDLTLSTVKDLCKANPSLTEVKDILKIIKRDVPLQKPLSEVIDGLLSVAVTDKDGSYHDYISMAVWAITAVSAYLKKTELTEWYPKLVGRQTAKNTEGQVERYCDHFAATCGFGGDLASAATKLSQAGYSPERMMLFTNHGAASAFLMAILNPAEEVTTSGYEPIYDRLDHVIEDTKLALLDEDLPNADKQEILDSIARGEQASELYRSQPYVQIRHTLATITKTWDHLTHLSLKDMVYSLDGAYAAFDAAVSTYSDGTLSYMASQLEVHK